MLEPARPLQHPPIHRVKQLVGSEYHSIRQLKINDLVNGFFRGQAGR